MAADKKIRISQCMIVKNEERNIERALSWGKDIMCEQIVVDTGSTDRTVELAEKAGASVYFYEWTDDFAAAKNYAIGKAKGDWIAFLDADEYMTPEDARTMQTVLDGSEERNFDGISTGWQQLDDKGQISWRRRIKERFISVMWSMIFPSFTQATRLFPWKEKAAETGS